MHPTKGPRANIRMHPRDAGKSKIYFIFKTILNSHHSFLNNRNRLMKMPFLLPLRKILIWMTHSYHDDVIEDNQSEYRVRSILCAVQWKTELNSITAPSLLYKKNYVHEVCNMGFRVEGSHFSGGTCLQKEPWLTSAANTIEVNHTGSNLKANAALKT